MSFELKEYINLINNRNLKEAIEYRKKYMPKTLYKYVGLSNNISCNKDNNSCIHNNNLNKSKFDALSNHLIWMSRYNNLNDPFEFKAMYLKRTVLEEKGWPLSMLDDYIERTRAAFLITSFTNSLVDNMPMWAHYSNNHKGFCIEYDVLNPKLVYPISYEEERFGIASILTSLFELTYKLYKGEINENNEEFQFYLTLITHFGLIKHKSWFYENEYRVIYVDSSENKLGMLIPSINVGLQIKRIFIGTQCSIENRDKLSNIANNIGIKIYEMYLDDIRYKLNYRQI